MVSALDSPLLNFSMEDIGVLIINDVVRYMNVDRSAEHKFSGCLIHSYPKMMQWHCSLV